MDPRIFRTHQRVLTCARVLMESGGPKAVTFSAVASLAKVSRQTLYRIWGDRESLLLDLARTMEHHNSLQASAEEPPVKVTAILPSIRDMAADQGFRIAVAGLLLRAAIDPADSVELRETVGQHLAALRETFGPMSEDEFVMAVGPVLMSSMFLQQDASDDLLRVLTVEAVSRRALAPREIDARAPTPAVMPIWDQHSPEGILLI